MSHEPSRDRTADQASRVAQALTQTEQAVTRTAQSQTHTDQAKTHTAQAETQAELEKIRQGESVLHFETRRQTKDGRQIDISVTASPLGGQLLRLQPELAIIITTGYSGVMTAEKVRELGFRELLNKPSTLRTLGETVHRVLHPNTSSTTAE
jgi:ActR/RegA family two-component response regulator